jgi:hypothetical protein
LIGRSFERPAQVDLARQPKPADFGLQRNGKMRVTAYTLGRTPPVPKAAWDENWLVLLA